MWIKSGHAWFGSCLFQSSRPIFHQGRREGFGERSSGNLLVPASLFLRYTTRLPNLLMNNTSSAAQVCFYMEEYVCVYVCEGTWCIPPMTIWVFSTSLTASVCMCVCVFMCVQHTPLIRATVGGEKSESCQAQNSQIGALSACVDITIQNPPTFLLYPPSVWTLVSLAAASCSVFLIASRSTNESRLFFVLRNK